MAFTLRIGLRSASRAYSKWPVAAAVVLTGVIAAHAETIRSMDYMTEPTANAAMQKAIDACVKQTGITVDRQAVPYPDLVQKVLLAAASKTLPDIIYIDNSDVAQLADGGSGVGCYLFGPGICWSGLTVKRSGCEVHALQMNS
jgi:ABC-type glycerol-3-phosphate transport system substrate-binding protein